MMAGGGTSFTAAQKRELLDRYHDLLPCELQKDFYDVMIIHPTDSDEDQDEARDYAKTLTNDIELEDGYVIKVTLLDDFAPEITSKFAKLENALKQCSLVFIFLTKNFTNSEEEQKYFTETALHEAINNPQKRSCVIPLFTDSVEDESHIPMYLNALCGIQCNQDKDPYYKSKISRIVSEKVEERKEKEEKQYLDQLNWAVKHHLTSS